MPQMRWLIVACRLIYSFPKSKASHPRTVLFYKLSGSRTMAATVLLLLSFRCCSLHAIKSLVIDIIHVLLQGCCWNPPFNLSLCVNNRVLCTKPRRNGKRFSWFSDLFWKICWNAWKWDYNSFHLSWPDLLYIYELLRLHIPSLHSSNALRYDWSLLFADTCLKNYPITNPVNCSNAGRGGSTSCSIVNATAHYDSALESTHTEMVRKCLTAAAMVTEILLLSPFPGKMHLNQLHTRVWYSCQLKKKQKNKISCWLCNVP